MTQKRIYKWNGGAFIAGVPARDLTADEAKKHGVTDHPLYTKETAKKAVKKDGS